MEGNPTLESFLGAASGSDLELEFIQKSNKRNRELPIQSYLCKTAHRFFWRFGGGSSLPYFNYLGIEN